MYMSFFFLAALSLRLRNAPSRQSRIAQHAVQQRRAIVALGAELRNKANVPRNETQRFSTPSG